MLVGLPMPRIGRVRRRAGGIDDEPLEKGGGGCRYTGKVPGVQMKHDCIYFHIRDSPQTGILAWAALYTTV